MNRAEGMGSLEYFKDQRVVVANPKSSVACTPSFYCVSIIDSNDGTIDMYAALLQSVFQLKKEESFSIAMKIKWQGAFQVGRYSKDVAETKVKIARNYAKNLHLKFDCILIKVGGYAI